MPIVRAVLTILLAGSCAAETAPATDLRTTEAGRALLARYLGTSDCESLGTGAIGVYATAAWRSEARLAARTAERAVPEVAAALGITPDRFLPFWILVAPGGGYLEREAPSWSAAVAQPDRRLVVLAGPAIRRTRMRVDETVTHEIAHLALHARLGEIGWVPRWFDEGLAMTLAGYRRTTDQLALAGRGPVRLRDLTDRFPQHPTLARQAYLESEAAVRRLLERGSLGPLLRRCAAGEEFEDAFRSVYGESLGDFSARVEAEVGRRWRWMAALGGGAALGGFMALLAIVGAVRVRHRARARLRAWETEERRLAAVEPPPDDVTP
jgi:hypothetical protein